MFQIKNFTSIVGAIINHMRGVQTDLTDFNIGSVARVMIEGPAVEIDEAYQQMFNGLMEAIPVATYESFNFTRLPAVPASGLITVEIAQNTSPITIGAGTVFSSPDARVGYASTADVIIAPGDTEATFLVVAQSAGKIGNVPPALSFTATPRPAGFVDAVNTASLAGGQDEETDDQRKQRFSQYISTLQRGTVQAIRYGAKTASRQSSSGVEVERVRAASVVEPYLLDPLEPISLVNVYVHNGVGGTTSDLVSEARKIIHGYTDPDTGAKVPGWKAAGVKVEVFAADEIVLDMTAVLTPAPGYDGAALTDAAEAVLADYAAGLDIEEPWVFAQAIFLVKSIQGVDNFVFSDPVADVAAGNNEKIVPGVIGVTVA